MSSPHVQHLSSSLFSPRTGQGRRFPVPCHPFQNPAPGTVMSRARSPDPCVLTRPCNYDIFSGIVGTPGKKLQGGGKGAKLMSLNL